MDRHFTFDAGGTFLFVANQDSDTIVTVRVDAGSGSLTPTGRVIDVCTPVCIAVSG